MDQAVLSEMGCSRLSISASNVSPVFSSSIDNIVQSVDLSEIGGCCGSDLGTTILAPFQVLPLPLIVLTFPKKPKYKEFALRGRRIVDIKPFFDEIINFKHNNLFSCSAEYLAITGEEQIGLCSKFLWNAVYANDAQSFTQMKKRSGTKIAINEAAILGTLSTGGGYSQLDEFLAFCDIPSMSFPTFGVSQNAITPYIHNSAYTFMEETGQEEAQLARVLGEVDVDDIPKITVIADCAWCIRSYKSNYNTSSGVGVIIGQRPKKILYLGIKNKYCFIYTKAENRKEEGAPHTYFKNWNKASTAMEFEII